MGERRARWRGQVRDRWLRRLRSAGVAVPVVGALAAAGLAATFARHDATTAPQAKPKPVDSQTSVTPTPTPSASAKARDDDHEGRQPTRQVKNTRPAPSPTLSSAGTSPPVTHSGGS